MIPRRAQRRDANEPELVRELRKAGVLWIYEGPLDGWAGRVGRGWLPVEVKDPRKPLSARKLTDAEAAFVRDCQAHQLPVVIAHTAEDVLRALALLP